MKKDIDSYQKQKQKQSEKRILNYLQTNEPAYQTQISQDLKMDTKVIKKTLVRLIDNKKVKIYHKRGFSKKRIYYIRTNARKKLRDSNEGRGKLTFDKMTKLKTGIPVLDEIFRLASLSEKLWRMGKQEDSYALIALISREYKKFKNPKVKLDMEELEAMVIASESILSKRAVCKKAGISVTRFDKLVSDYPHLSNLRKRLQRLSSISLDPSDNL